MGVEKLRRNIWTECEKVLTVLCAPSILGSFKVSAHSEFMKIKSFN